MPLIAQARAAYLAADVFEHIAHTQARQDLVVFAVSCYKIVRAVAMHVQHLRWQETMAHEYVGPESCTYVRTHQEYQEVHQEDRGLQGH